MIFYLDFGKALYRIDVSETISATLIANITRTGDFDLVKAEPKTLCSDEIEQLRANLTDILGELNFNFPLGHGTGV